MDLIRDRLLAGAKGRDIRTELDRLGVGKRAVDRMLADVRKQIDRGVEDARRQLGLGWSDRQIVLGLREQGFPEHVSRRVVRRAKRLNLEATGRPALDLLGESYEFYRGIFGDQTQSTSTRIRARQLADRLLGLDQVDAHQLQRDVQVQQVVLTPTQRDARLQTIIGEVMSKTDGRSQ